MTDMDNGAEIDIVLNGRAATVRIPLAGQPGQEWCLRYQELARSRNLPAHAEESPGRTWLVVDLPGYAGPSDATARLDEARDLVGATDAAAQAADTGEIEQAVRDWWIQQRG